MALLSAGGGEYIPHPQGLWTGTLVEVKAITDTFGERIRWVFETNCRDDEGKPRRVSLKSSYRGLGNEKAWLHRILLAFDHDPLNPYWTSFEDLGGFQFLIDRKTQLGLEVTWYEKKRKPGEDITYGDNVADVMTLPQLAQKKAALRASLDASDGVAPTGAPAGFKPPHAPPASAGKAPPPNPSGSRMAPPDDYVPEPPFDDPFSDE